MLVIGLTGSIGMGKSVTAQMLRKMGIPVYDADNAVRQLTTRAGKAIPAIAQVFPGVVTANILDRNALGARVFGDPAALKRLEAILHPLAAQARQGFLRTAARRRRSIVALDIPLLFETGADAEVDTVIVVTAPAALQRHRVLRRPGMTPEKLAGILARQCPDRLKRRRADHIVPTGLGRAVTWRRLRRILRHLAVHPPRRNPR